MQLDISHLNPQEQAILQALSDNGGLDIGTDGYGQLIIYTNLAVQADTLEEYENPTLVPFDPNAPDGAYYVD